MRGLTPGRPGPRPDDQLLVLTFDGKGIVMRPDALRPDAAKAAAKAAASARHKLATRLSPGEKHGRKRMAELAAVYDAAPAPRVPADIIRLPGHDGHPRKRGPAAAGKWLTASVTKDIAAVIAAGFAEAERRDPGHGRTWMALVDGNATQIEAIAGAGWRGVAGAGERRPPGGAPPGLAGRGHRAHGRAGSQDTDQGLAEHGRAPAPTVREQSRAHGWRTGIHAACEPLRHLF